MLADIHRRIVNGRVAQATMMRVPRPSRFCLGGSFSLDFINRWAGREITIWCRGREKMEVRETELSHPTKRRLGGAPGTRPTRAEALD